MAKQQWKVVIITLILSLVSIRYFINVKIDNQAFEIGHRHVKYHANWTQKFESLKNVHELQDAYKLRNIQSMDLSLSMSSLKFNDIKKLLPVQFQVYKTLKINLANNPIGTDGADYVLSLIPNGIEELQIAFDSIQADSNLGTILTKRLNNLNSLKRLKLSLILAVKDQVIVDDYLRFGRLGNQLQSYSLILMGNGLTNKSLGYLQTHLSRANLRSLDLNLYSNKLQKQGAELVANALKTQKNLQYLNVDLYFNNITATGTQYICDSIQSIATDKLKQLQLNFDFNNILNEGGKTIGQLLSKLTSLQKLNLGVASKNFGYNGYKHVVNGLSHLTKLTDLTLRAGINRVGGGGATVTKGLLLKLVNLRSLNINFYENYVGDQGAIQMVQAITQLSHLETLDLNFGFNDIKGYALIRIIQLLAQQSYNSLYLGFSSNQVQDPQVNMFEDNLKQIIQKTKKKFQFQFMETAISKNAQSKISNLFKSQFGSNKKLIVHVNSIITADQQTQYQKKYEARTEQLKKLSEGDKKKAGKKITQTVVENNQQKAEETLQLDNQQRNQAKENAQL